MIEERIEVVLGDDGSLMAKTDGLKGATCQEELEALMEEVAEVNTIERTSEAYEQPPSMRVSAKSRLQGGRA